MRTERIAPATIEFDADGVAHAPAFGDRYHPRAGALAQAEHVFLRGNGLPARWAGRRRFVVLETGFGLGHNFLATWAAWRNDPARCERLHVVSVELHPPRRDDLVAAHRALPSAVTPLAHALHAAWPVLTGDLHRLAFDDGRVELLLALGDAARWLRRLQLQADALFLDGFAPERNAAMWSPALFGALPALCAEGATAATWSVARAVRDGLAAAGFDVHTAPGFADKREMTTARFAPRHALRPAARRQAAVPGARDALVIGGGIAGACSAAALAAQGLTVTVLDAAAGPAAGASGNAAGLLRGLVTRDDGPHGRWHRAAALQAQRLFGPWVAHGAVPGQLGGLLHLGDDDASVQALAAPWPADYVQALSARDATARAGVALARPAWLFPQGGWVSPAALVRQVLATRGIHWRGGVPVRALRRHGDRWQALDAAGTVLADAQLLVLATGAALGALAPAGCARWWPLAVSRGQVTQIPAHLVAREGGAAVRPALPLARSGYVIPLPDGGLLCGATQAGDDLDADLRPADHAHNLAVWQRLTGQPAGAGSIDATTAAALPGRVGWRTHTDDRLPLVGPVPASALAQFGAASASASSPEAALLAAARRERWAQPARVPREPGLFVLGALGSRGLTSAALGAQVLAALVCDTPLPVDTDLLDAVDAARHVARAVRRLPR
ncbi:MAG: FAD-dependent 5-carboxymethylaminomethyl-2-thiouridine(34) oxidoreductase MnmC [Rubrivivax sp.]|nr:FAD-dependent 5-carboxymethylaminomethyl-2-thiouridine(34) oxidoreductase MnmC [Rubrivivax sp.]